MYNVKYSHVRKRQYDHVARHVPENVLRHGHILQAEINVSTQFYLKSQSHKITNPSQEFK